MTIYLPVGSVLYVDTSSTSTPTWTKLSEHNRAPVGLDNQRFEKTQRMSNGQLRKIFIADKKSAAMYYEQFGTLKGFKGKLYKS